MKTIFILFFLHTITAVGDLASANESFFDKSPVSKEIPIEKADIEPTAENNSHQVLIYQPPDSAQAWDPMPGDQGGGFTQTRLTYFSASDDAVSKEVFDQVILTGSDVDPTDTHTAYSILSQLPKPEVLQDTMAGGDHFRITSGNSTSTQSTVQAGSTPNLVCCECGYCLGQNASVRESEEPFPLNIHPVIGATKKQAEDHACFVACTEKNSNKDPERTHPFGESISKAQCKGGETETVCVDPPYAEELL